MKQNLPTHHRRRGIALVTVIAMVALMTLLMVAMFSLSQSELKTALNHSNGQQARQLSEVAVNLAISQLRKGTSQNTNAQGWEAWASQPGLVRSFDTAGQTQAAYKLYSSSQLILRTAGEVEKLLLADIPPFDWQEKPQRYVDLNKPAVRADRDGVPKLIFPIVDPRAQTGDPLTHVGGFSYSGQTVTGMPVSGVRTTGGDSQRVPMPVEWLYMLKDGTLGSLDVNGEFVGPSTPTGGNPITGRIAFWTDDETSKVNINTASEPTPWAVPTFFYDQDANYARYQPLNSEFQRYPGHPAMTALSPILFPGQTLSPMQKEAIYDLVPKIGRGGSKAGTKAYSDPDVAAIELAQFRGERLYASLDELLLREDRQPNKLGTQVIGADRLQRSTFFLTAHSRAPESNPYGLPKIAIWPISYRGTDYRTAFDQLISFCSTLRTSTSERAYVFQRGWADSTTEDIDRIENKSLLSYLKDLLKNPVPGFSASANQTFDKKYGEDLPQILVEIFDYIRGINVHDGSLVTEKFDGSGKAQNFMLGYEPGSVRPSTFKTFTDPRFFGADSDGSEGGGQVEKLGYPGHGQVTPSRWTVGTETYQGIGRFATVSEVGLHFICCADNTEDAKNPFTQSYAFLGKPGGSSAPKINPSSDADRWYSNFPPGPPIPQVNPPNMTKYPLTGGFPYGTDPQHPGYKSENWNHQLVTNTPLRPGFRRVQARVVLEFFVPAAGYTILEPDMTIRVNGLDQFQVNGMPLFPHGTELIRTGRRATHVGNQMSGGYGVGTKGLMRGREIPARMPMPADNNWGADNWKVKPSSQSSDDMCVLNYDLISNFIDIEVGPDGSVPMQVSQGDIQVEVWSGHIGRTPSTLEKAAALVQTLNMRFPANTVKAPTLVRNPIVATTAGTVTHPGAEAPTWWTFYSRGCLGFSRDSLIGRDKLGPVAGPLMRGRYFNENVQSRLQNEPRRGAFFYGFDAVVQGAPRPFRPQQTNATTQQAVDAAEEAEGSDVVQTVTIRHGDYRLTSALAVVPADQWLPHRNYGTRRLAHSFSNFLSDELPGYDYGGRVDFENRLVPTDQAATYPNTRIPDFPYFSDAKTAAHRYGDFDNGPGPARDGPYINKPDEGNLNTVATGTAYFTESGQHKSTEKDFYAPNRMIPSPVTFGSLPSGVKARDPWRTLLFRRQQGHPGGPAKFGGIDPADHLLLEFFWMPVVEPYAISEPFSTAGKINLNYQIFPFTHIRRATGIHAVLAGEIISAVPTADAPNYKVFPDSSNKNQFWGATQSKTWHYKIDAEKTLTQFDARFKLGKAFISPSEICDIHLVPEDSAASAAAMENFWATRKLTGDNTRERPYAGIYPRLTTRSNTFRVHYIAQTIQKTRSSDPAKMEAADKVSGEFRGSSLIERHLDPAQKGLPDFATNAAGRTLDQYHEFRVLETQRFGY